MKIRYKIILVSILLLLVLSVLPQTASAQTPLQWQVGQPIVPCGLSGDYDPATPGIQSNHPSTTWDDSQPSTSCDLFSLSRNVIDFALVIMIPIATLLFIIGGLMIIFGGANQGMLGKGKTIFWNTFIGLLILLAPAPHEMAACIILSPLSSLPKSAASAP